MDEDLVTRAITEEELAAAEIGRVVRGGSKRLLRHLNRQIGTDAMTDADPRPPFRADHVGSLLRSRRLIDAHQAQIAGKLPAADLSAIEDEEIRNAVAIQERVGIRAITDGELRRNNWRDRFFERVEGFSQERIPSSFILHRVLQAAKPAPERSLSPGASR